MEQDKNQYNEYGLKHGYWEEVLIFKRSGNYKNGERQGWWSFYTGMYGENLQYELLYSNDIILKVIAYDKNTSIEKEVIIIR